MKVLAPLKDQEIDWLGKLTVARQNHLFILQIYAYPDHHPPSPHRQWLVELINNHDNVQILRLSTTYFHIMSQVQVSCSLRENHKLDRNVGNQKLF